MSMDQARFRHNQSVSGDDFHTNETDLNKLEGGALRKSTVNNKKTSIPCSRLILLLILISFFVTSAVFVISRVKKPAHVLNGPSGFENLPVIATHKINTVNKNAIPFLTYKKIKKNMDKNDVSFGSVREESGLLAEFIKTVKNMEEPVFKPTPDSEGIVMTCTLNEVCVANLVYLFDVLQITAKVELWLERATVSQKLVNILQNRWQDSLYVKYFDDIMGTYIDTFGVLDSKRYSYYFKVMAIVGSEFERVFWIDGDAFLLQDVDQFFRQSSSDAVFWHDVWRLAPNNPIWKVLNRTKHYEGLAQDSGILFINKAKRWRSLYVAAYMNQKQQFYYSLLWGDKDTFFLAFDLMEESYTFVPFSPLILGKTVEELRTDENVDEDVLQNTDFRGYSFVQPDSEGKALCVHLVIGKKRIIPYLKQGKRLFSQIREYDPDRSHVGYFQPFRDIVMDEGEFYGPLIGSTGALGHFEQRFIYCYYEAEYLVHKYGSN